MNNMRTGNKGTENREHEAEVMARLLRDAVPPMGEDSSQERDLWPAMQQRLNAGGGITAKLGAVPWFDWALAGGVALFAAAVPAAVPVLLYYL